MKNGLALSVFPGLDLLGRAFEDEGFVLVRGPDTLWGGDIKNFHPPRSIFEGIIGGPPCQAHSTLYKFGNSRAIDMTGEFLRVFHEAAPSWAVMENVRGLLNSGVMPDDWAAINLRDWDCGGMTHRRRIFWVYPATLILVPPKLPGAPEYSVLASSWKEHGSINKQNPRMQGKLTIERAAELQGYPELASILKPMGKQYAVSLLGNGVPRQMGLYIARAIKNQISEVSHV